MRTPRQLPVSWRSQLDEEARVATFHPNLVNDTGNFSLQRGKAFGCRWRCFRPRMTLFRITNDAVSDYGWRCFRPRVTMFRTTDDAVSDHGWRCFRPRMTMFQTTDDAVSDDGWRCFGLRMALFQTTNDNVSDHGWRCFRPHKCFLPAFRRVR